MELAAFHYCLLPCPYDRVVGYCWRSYGLLGLDVGGRGVAEIEDELLAPRELRGRPFTLADAIGKAGAGLLKGDAAVPRPLRARALLDGFVDSHLVDGPGALRIVLKQVVREDLRVSRSFDVPMVAFEGILREVVAEPEVLYELARRVAVVWGELYGERPYFQVPGGEAHPDAEYCHGSVREALAGLVCRVRVRSDWAVDLEMPL